MSDLNPPEPQKRPVNNDSPERNKQTQYETINKGPSLSLRFSSLTLDELSEQLDRRIKETHELQEEVENAAREALRRFECTKDNRSPGQTFHKHDLDKEFTSCLAHKQAVTQSVVSCLDALKLEEVVQGSGPHEKEVLEDAIDNCLEQLLDLQLHKAHSEEQEMFSLPTAITTLQVKLHEALREKVVLSDRSLKDSKKDVDQMEKMLHLLEGLQDIKRSADQKLQETEGAASALHRKVESLEKSVKRLYHTLYGKQFRHSSTCNKTMMHQEPQSAQHANKNLQRDTDKQHWKILSSKEQQRIEACEELNKQERVEDLITSLGHEMAMLTDTLSSSKHSGVNFCAKLEQLKNLAERQTWLHQRQISELESTISSYNDKVGYLEETILEIRTQLFATQKERDQSLQQANQLQSQLQQLKSRCENQQLKLNEDIEALRGQLDLARKQLCRAGEEKSCLQALLEQRSQEHLVSVQYQSQTLQAERDALRLKLTEREKMIDILRLQMESSIQTAARHSDTITNLQQENSFLISQHKQEIQQLKAELVQCKSDLVCVERKRRQLCASLTEQNQRIQEETLEKQQVLKQLKLQQMQLFNLNKEHDELQQLHNCKNDEHEGVVLKLQGQLSSAHEELDKIRRSLRTLQAADGHGLQVALEMQKELTTRREEVDSLQSRIQHLEEKVEKLQQEKQSQNLETHRQLQELIFVREEKRQLACELKALRSRDHQLRERISELEAILHKMWESLANCKDFLQLREQEYFHLKLQNALNLKELPGHLSADPLGSPPETNSGTLSAPTAPPSSQNPYNTQIMVQERSLCELRSLIKEMQAAISDNHRPHTYKSAVSSRSSNFHRRRSAPERQHTATFRTEDEGGVKACSRLRRKTCGSEPRFLKTAELNGQTVNHRDGPFTSSPVSGAKYTMFQRMLLLGRRSPVYALLTSDPDS